MNSVTWLATLTMLALQFRTSPASTCFLETVPFSEVTLSNGTVLSSDVLQIDGNTSWCASGSNQYLQIDFGSVHVVCGVAVQGNLGSNSTSSQRFFLSFVIENTVSVFPQEEESSDGENLIVHPDGSNTTQRELITPQPARYVRFYPVASDNGGMEACLRVQVYGRPAVRVTCNQNGTVEVNLTRGVIGPDISNLTLNDPLCSYAVPAGDADIILTFSVNQCGTLASEFTGDGFLYFNNTVLGQVGGVIPTVTHDVSFPVLCSYDRNDTVSKFFQPIHNSTSSHEGFGMFTFSFQLYTDASLSTLYNNQILELRTPLYARVAAVGTSFVKVLMISRCWATPTYNGNDAMFFYLIIDNCAVSSPLIQFTCANGSLSQDFLLRAFRFPVVYNSVYIHCELRVCINETVNQCDDSCAACSKRRRRSLDERRHDNGGTEDLYRVDFPPFIVKDEQQTEGSVRNEQGLLDTTGINIIAICGALVVAIVCATMFIAKRINQKSACDRDTVQAAKNGGYIHDKPASTEA